jgi:N-acetylglucosamine repressor
LTKGGTLATIDFVNLAWQTCAEGRARSEEEEEATLPAKATHSQTRRHNQQLVLRTIYDRQATSRAEVARLTGLTRTSVSKLVAELIGNGLVAEVGRGPSSGGKAPILLSVIPDSRHVIGLDLGDALFSGAVVDLRGRILDSLSRPLDGRDGRAALQLVFDVIDALISSNGKRPLLGIGIGTPGLIDSASGTVRWAVNLDWAELALGPIVSERYGVPVVVANDSQAAALAELTFAELGRRANLIVIRVGRGLGAGIIVNGQLFQGDGSGAGEIGHTASLTGNEQCRCGSVGCLETVASMRAMVASAGRVDPEVVDDTSLVRAFRAGQPQVRRVVIDAAHALGLAIGGLIGALNVGRIVLVGPAAALGDDWLAAVREKALASSLPMLARTTSIELRQTGDDGVLLGASALLMTRELGLSAVR